MPTRSPVGAGASRLASARAAGDSGEVNGPDEQTGWRTSGGPSLPGSFRSIAVPTGARVAWRRFLAFAGPGYMVAVGYMDPGNWATDLAGGSAFGYDLLFVVLLSNALAILLQALAARLGIATGRDLAAACRDAYPRPVAIALWLLCEIAIVACDIAEVIGTAIGLQLLFGLPLVAGVLLTTLDVLLILALQKRGFRRLEAFVMVLIATVAACFGIELILSRPDVAAVLAGFVPHARLVTDPARLYIAIGIVGATVMPHNLYLHSAAVQTRAFERDDAGKRQAAWYATLDSSIALMLALFVNAAILILAASAFHVAGRTDVAEIQDAYHLLAPALGAGAARTLFAVALLASGQNSTVTATLAGQVVMEGFLHLTIAPWKRRLITRALAVVPAAIVAVRYGEAGTARLLVFSQVVLSMQLPFAVIPLVRITSDRRRMGVLASPRWVKALAWTAAALIVGLNGWLLLATAGITI
jgi:manganese transport protein